MLSKKEKLQKKRIAFGKDVYQINPNNKPTKIQIKPFLNDFKSLSVRLRIFIALDCREERIIRILCDNKIVGSFDIRFAYVNQVFETSLQLPASCEKIFLVQTKGLSSTYIYKENPFSPVLISEQTSENPISSFFTTLNSDLIIQPFGWMEGCVLDGLLTLNKMEEIQNHLSHFIINDNLVYENPRSKIADNTLYGIEGALPFAFITSPKVLEIFDDFVSNYSSSELITDAEFVSAEGCY
ncbi:MAG: hypothetical protein PHD05_09015, partial [Sphaerochaetaceae bacterium]|nr:hypothetical protein [Sphaerochaetaceae bacterium]